MRIGLPLLLLILLAACGSGSPQATEAASAPIPNRPTTVEDSKVRDWLVTTAESDAGVTINVQERVSSTWVPLQIREMPYPAGYEPHAEFGHLRKVTVALSGDRLFVAFARADGDGSPGQESIASKCFVLRLPDVDPTEVGIDLQDCFVSAATQSLGGWLIGSRQRLESRGTHLAIESLVVEGTTASRRIIWTNGAVGSIANAMHSKEIDAFCRNGIHVIALDDVVRPKYGVRLVEARNGVAVVDQFDLPTGPNERYFAAAFDGDRLLALSNYSTQGSQGHRLRLLGLPGRGMEQAAEWVERIPRARKDYELQYDKAEVLTGEKFTPWFDVVAMGDKALVAAGGRGLMVFDLRDAVGPISTAEVGGVALDVTRWRDEVLVLTRAGEATWISRIVREDSGSFRVERLVEVAHADRFAD